MGAGLKPRVVKFRANSSVAQGSFENIDELIGSMMGCHACLIVVGGGFGDHEVNFLCGVLSVLTVPAGAVRTDVGSLCVLRAHSEPTACGRFTGNLWKLLLRCP